MEHMELCPTSTSSVQFVFLKGRDWKAENLYFPDSLQKKSSLCELGSANQTHVGEIVESGSETKAVSLPCCHIYSASTGADFK